MTDKAREEFEQVYSEQFGFDPGFCWDGSGYTRAHPAGAWWAWQASRAALVVELPMAAKLFPHACEAMNANSVREAIAKAGVTVK